MADDEHRNDQGAHGADPQWTFVNEPQQSHAIGKADEEPFGIYLDQEAMRHIDKAISSQSVAQWRGLLLGRPFRSRRRPFLLVTHVLWSPDALETEDELLFTPKGLDEMTREAASAHPELTVVGWFHITPHRGGTTLLPIERTTHQRLFLDPWQVALLIDSEQKSSWLYRWDGNRLVPCHAFYVWNASQDSHLMAAPLRQEPWTPPSSPKHPALVSPNVHPDSQSQADHPDLDAPLDMNDDRQADALPQRRSKNRYLLGLVALALLIVYLLIPGAPGSLSWMARLGANQEMQLQELEQSLQQLEEETQALHAQRVVVEQSVPEPVTAESDGAESRSTQPQATPSLEEEVLPPSPQPPAPTEISSPASSSLEDRLLEQPGQTIVTTTPASAESTSAAGEELNEAPASLQTTLGREYIIQPGDTMWRISDQLLGDPSAFRSLADDNDIADPDRIFPGQRLLVPEPGSP